MCAAALTFTTRPVFNTCICICVTYLILSIDVQISIIQNAFDSFEPPIFCNIVENSISILKQKMYMYKLYNNCKAAFWCLVQLHVLNLFCIWRLLVHTCMSYARVWCKCSFKNVLQYTVL